MKTNIFIFLLSFLTFFNFIAAQQGDGGTPISFKFAYEPEIPVISLAQPNIDSLLAEDASKDGKGLGPWRFGYVHAINLNVNNAGQWFDLPNGGKLWLMQIHCENALTVNLTFGNSRIPEGNQLFVYDINRQFVLGKFEAKHLVEGALGAELIDGTNVIVEYYVAPENQQNIGFIQIQSATHGYRTAQDFNRAFGSSGSCNMNVNCPDGLPFENQRNAAVMLVSGSNGFCSGSLINNTANDGKPYVLTARHCGNSGFANWIFRFNWQSTGCNNPGSSPSFQSMSGSVSRAGRQESDMRLVEITGGLEGGTVPASYNPFFAGWDNSGDAPSSTFCVHHPSGDIKKIAFDDDPSFAVQAMGSNEPNSSWQVQWDRNTTTEPGSSGSPLYDQNGRIIGQLWGGGASCTNLSAPDYYGRVSNSWAPAGSTNAQQLKHWLDPNNSGVSFSNGYPEGPLPDTDGAIAQGTNWELTGIVCGNSVTPTINITNAGQNTITNMVISYFYGSGAPANYNWSGSIATGQTAAVTLPNQVLSGGNYTFTANLVSVNGQTDDNESNNVLTSSFTIVEAGLFINMNLQLDCFGSEITWRLLNQFETQVLYTGGPYNNAFSNPPLINESWCLPEACYILEVNDSYGDGLAGGGFCSVIGSLQIVEGSEILDEITEQNANFGSQKKMPFCIGDATNSIDVLIDDWNFTLYPNPSSTEIHLNFNAIGEKQLQVLTTDGKLLQNTQTTASFITLDVNELAPGVYFVQVENGGKLRVAKFIKQ